MFNIKRARLADIGRRCAMPLMLAVCTLFYYFGELVDWAAWDALRWNFFYGIHDVHRLLFLAPIIYAGYHARARGALITTLIALAIFLPRAFFISPYPDPILRMVLFTITAGAIGVLVGMIRNRSERCCRLEETVRSERDILLGIIAGAGDGVVIIGPDHSIRFVNTNMVAWLGSGKGQICYQYLNGRDTTCAKGCRLAEVAQQGRTVCWQKDLTGNKTCQALGIPYIDSDGAVCQLTVLRDVVPAGRAKGEHPGENGFSWLSLKL